MDFYVNPGGVIGGDLRVVGDKSISHRAVMLSALATGVSRIDGLLTGTDVLATVQAFQDMGVNIQTGEAENQLIVYGVGKYGLSAPSKPLDLGNSGTAMRLLAGLLCGQRFPSELVGDESLSIRPMGRITEPLSRMGADIRTDDKGHPPLFIRPVKKLSGLRYSMPIASAQVKSAILLAGLYSDESVCVHEPAVSRDHTERMLQGFGCSLNVQDSWVCLESRELISCDIEVPADFSSASFFIVAACIASQGQLRLRHVGVNPTRTGALQILKAMGADIVLENQRLIGGEPVADIVVRSSKLMGLDISPDLVPLAIDEFPILCVASACADGVTKIQGARELRYKESDRIHAIALGLRSLGIEVEESSDGMTIVGQGTFEGGRIDSLGDHRIAMSFAVGALRARNAVEILNCDNVETSFPTFVQQSRSVGLDIHVSG